MNEYTVVWKIEIYADSPEEAAALALEVQRDPESEATFFDVYEGMQSVNARKIVS